MLPGPCRDAKAWQWILQVSLSLQPNHTLQCREALIPNLLIYLELLKAAWGLEASVIFGTTAVVKMVDSSAQAVSIAWKAQETRELRLESESEVL